MQNNPASENGQERSAARAALLTAARTLAERDGVESVTLSKVASEAGVPRAAVYGQFARKEDLLMSIVSDDLAALARGMQGIDWPPQGGETPESAVILSLPRPPETAPAEAPAEMIDAAKDVSAALAAAPAVETPQPRQRLTRRTELAQVLDTKPAAEDGEARAAKRRARRWAAARRTPGSSAVFAPSSAACRVSKRARSRWRRTPAPQRLRHRKPSRRWKRRSRELKERADAAEARLKSVGQRNAPGAERDGAAPADRRRRGARGAGGEPTRA